jgi:hypothetical protein
LPTWFSTCPFSHPEAGVQATGLDQVMRAHLQKATIISTRLANKDRFDRRLQVVVDAAPAETAIGLERS